MVDDATQTANTGKKISQNMIDGYSELNENITKTLETISDVETASKEQKTGIEQINDAVTSLDQETQKIASVASQTHDIALETDSVAKDVVANVNEKEFIGKDSVKAKDMGNKKVVSAPTIQSKQTAKTQKPVSKSTIKPVVSKTTENDEWASF